MGTDHQLLPVLRQGGVGYQLEQVLSASLPRTGGAAPSAAAGADAGTTPPAPVVAAGSADGRGSLTFGTGTTPAAGDMVAVTFAAPYAAKPVVTVNAASANITKAVVGTLAAVDVTTTGFKIRSSAAPGASQPNTTYAVEYRVDPRRQPLSPMHGEPGKLGRLVGMPHPEEAPEGKLVEDCRRLEDEVSQLESRNSKRAERWRSLHLAGGVFVGFGVIIAAITAWRHPDQPIGFTLLASAVVANLVLSLQPQDRAAIHTKVQDRCFSLRRDLRRFRELTVLEPESFPGAHELVLWLLSLDVAELIDAEQDVP